MARRSKRSSRPRSRIRRWFFGFNLAVVFILGGWYFAQPAARQQEVRRLVASSLERDKHVSAIDVAWDVWQLYYADRATGRIAAGDKTFTYAGAPLRQNAPGAAPLRVLVNRGYVVGYDDARGNPAWAAYHMRDLASLPPAPPRPDKFETDRRTAARISSDSYTGTGYDRGHLAPNYAIATHYGVAAQQETFLMSNIAPQLHSLNAGLWKELEQKIATSYPARYEEVWALAGPVYGAHPRQLRGGVTVPDAFFLILVDEHEGRLRTLALIVPQDAPPDGNPSAYLTSIAEIERRTHLDFFPELDDATEHAVEARQAARVW